MEWFFYSLELNVLDLVSPLLSCCLVYFYLSLLASVYVTFQKCFLRLRS